MATATKTKTVVSTPQSTPTRWADANSVTFSGRVFHAELVKGPYSEFVSLDIITRPIKDDDDSSIVLHLTTSQLVAFFKAGGIPTGRSVTITGNMTGMEFAYTNKEGEVVPLNRPRMLIGEHFLVWGAKPSAK